MSEQEKILEEIEDNTSVPTIKTAPWSVRDTVFAVITLVCSISFVSFSLFGGFSLGFTVSYIVFFALTVAYMARSNLSFSVFPLFCGGVSLALCPVFTLYRDLLINTLIFIAVFALYGIFVAYTYSFAQSGRSVILETAGTLAVTPFMSMSEPFSSYDAYCTDKKGPNKQIIMGIVLSVPVLIVVLPLLINSDAAFEGLMTTLFKGFGKLILRIILGTVLALILFSLFFAVKKGLKEEDKQPIFENNYKNIPAATSVTLFIIVSVFYAVYLLSQLAYFFSGFSGILPEGYSLTASDYARRGFFELCGVCAINLGLIAVITAFSKRTEENKIPLSVKITATVICFFSLVFTATALSKMLLYIGFLGLTRLRLLTGIFMLFIALVFIGVVLFLYVRKMPLEKYIIVSLAVFALTVGYMDVDKTIAKYNVTAYEKEILEEVDVHHLGELSASAVPYLAELLKTRDPWVREYAANELYNIAEEYYEIEESGNKIKLKPKKEEKLYEYNRSTANAKEIIRKNIGKIFAEKTSVTEEYETWY